MITYRFGAIDNATENQVKRTVDVNKRTTAEPGDLNPADLMMGTDLASAYFENMIKLPYSAIKNHQREIKQV